MQPDTITHTLPQTKPIPKTCKSRWFAETSNDNPRNNNRNPIQLREYDCVFDCMRWKTTCETLAPDVSLYTQILHTAPCTIQTTQTQLKVIVR